MKIGSIYTAVALVAVMTLLSMLPRFFGIEGFTTLSPANTYSAGYESRGPMDGNKTDCDDLVVAQQFEGPISVVQAGGNAFAPLADPKVDMKLNQLFDYTRNRTSVEQSAFLSSNLSTSTGAVIPTMEQVRALDMRGGNRGQGMYI